MQLQGRAVLTAPGRERENFLNIYEQLPKCALTLLPVLSFIYGMSYGRLISTKPLPIVNQFIMLCPVPQKYLLDAFSKILSGWCDRIFPVLPMWVISLHHIHSSTRKLSMLYALGFTRYTSSKFTSNLFIFIRFFLINPYQVCILMFKVLPFGQDKISPCLYHKSIMEISLITSECNDLFFFNCQFL